MKVKYWMTKDPITIGPDTSMADAARIMKEHHFRRLPVMERDRLVGLVTYRNIIEAQPSPATSLSVHEIRYLTSKLKVSEVMRKKLVTISPEDDIFQAMLEGNKQGLGCYPVVDAGKLVGIVTATDLFNLVVHLLGPDDETAFVYLKVNEEDFKSPDFLKRILEILAPAELAITSFFSYPAKGPEGAMALMRLSSGRGPEAAALFKNAGYEVLS